MPLGGPMSRKFNPFRRRTKTRSVTIRAAWIAGICAIAAAIIGTVLTSQLSRTPAPSSASPVTSVTDTAGPNLKLDEVEIVQAAHIDASNQGPGEGAPTPGKDTGSAIDVTLRNNGDAPALIVKAV